MLNNYNASSLERCVSSWACIPSGSLATVLPLGCLRHGERRILSSIRCRARYSGRMGESLFCDSFYL